jgi:hypothetical protein
MNFKESYPDFASIEEHVRRARLERSVAIAHFIADFFDETNRGLKRLARALGVKRAGALPKWSQPQPFPKLPSEG